MIFGLRKKKRSRSFRASADSFWDWFSSNSQRLLAAIEAGKLETLTGELQAVTAEFLPRLSWVFGPGENGGHSFTVTGEGDKSLQFLAEQCRVMAPSLPGWTFYASRQASDAESVRNMAISLGGGSSIDAESFSVLPRINEESERIDIWLWHDSLAQVPQDHHYQIAFLFLDEVLGEFGTQTLIGEIEFEDCRDEPGVIAICDLGDHARQLAEEQDWNVDSPLNTYSVYEVEEPPGGFPRGDTRVGTTCHPTLVMDFLNHGGPLVEDPLAETGAAFTYLAIDGILFPEGRPVDVRGEAEDALKAQLTEHDAGRPLGGALGFEYAYIDLLLVDGDQSRKIVDSVMRGMGWQGRYKMLPFAK